MKPCGIIVLLSELFTSESKSQVYANVHEYFRKHPVVSKNIGIVSLHVYIVHDVYMNTYMHVLSAAAHNMS